MLFGFIALIVGRTVIASHSQQPVPIRTKLPPIRPDTAAGHLAQAIRIRTVSRDVGSQDKTELLHLREWLATTYPKLHQVAHREILPSGTLLFVWPGRNPVLPPLVLMAHQDVVPADEIARWRQPPFEGVVRDGVIWGRGAIDDKGSLVAIMEAAESLANTNRSPERGVILLFGHDEEAGGTGAREAAAWLNAKEVRPWFVLDEGSLAISDHPVTHRPAALVGISEKGYLTLRLDAAADGGHSSAPPDHAAINDLAKATLAVTDGPFPRHYRGATRQMLEALAPEAPIMTRTAIANSWLFESILRSAMGATPQGAAMLHTTIAPTMLRGSSKENVLPTVASVWINFRIAPEDSVKGVTDHVRHALKDQKIKISVVGNPQEPSPASPVDSEGYRFLAGVIQGQFAMPAVPAPVIAQTDSRALRTVTPAIYRFQPVALTIKDTEMLHGINERISVRDFARMITFYQTLIQGPSSTGVPPR
jgi:carboxypeptidase PM20D1